MKLKRHFANPKNGYYGICGIRTDRTVTDVVDVTCKHCEDLLISDNTNYISGYRKQVARQIYAPNVVEFRTRKP